MLTPAELHILALEERLRQATLRNDPNETDALLAGDWLNTNANGSMSTKAQLLALIDSFNFVSIINEDVQVRVFSGLAIVTGRSTRQLRNNENMVTTNLVRFTRVYAELDGRWQVVASQATPIPG